MNEGFFPNQSILIKNKEKENMKKTMIRMKDKGKW